MLLHRWLLPILFLFRGPASLQQVQLAQPSSCLYLWVIVSHGCPMYICTIMLYACRCSSDMPCHALTRQYLHGVTLPGLHRQTIAGLAVPSEWPNSSTNTAEVSKTPAFLISACEQLFMEMMSLASSEVQANNKLACIQQDVPAVFLQKDSSCISA